MSVVHNILNDTDTNDTMGGVWEGKLAMVA